MNPTKESDYSMFTCGSASIYLNNMYAHYGGKEDDLWCKDSLSSVSLKKEEDIVTKVKILPYDLEQERDLRFRKYLSSKVNIKQMLLFSWTPKYMLELTS